MSCFTFYTLLSTLTVQSLDWMGSMRKSWWRCYLSHSPSLVSNQGFGDGEWEIMRHHKDFLTSRPIIGLEKRDKSIIDSCTRYEWATPIKKLSKKLSLTHIFTNQWSLFLFQSSLGTLPTPYFYGISSKYDVAAYPRPKVNLRSINCAYRRDLVAED